MTHSTTNTAARELLPCVMCGCPDELELDSSSAAEASWIECNACQYRMQEKCDEETLAERWNELDRRDMPAFVTPTETPARDVPAQEASLRRSLDYWHGRAKTAEAKLTQQQGGEQEAFESWIQQRHGLSVERWADSGKYKYDDTGRWWECWQSASAVRSPS